MARGNRSSGRRESTQTALTSNHSSSVTSEPLPPFLYGGRVDTQLFQQGETDIMDNMGSSPASSICPTCHQSVTAEWHFCPNCGKNLKGKPPSTTWLTQTGLYLLGVLLPPFGLWPGIRYLRNTDAHVRRVGLVVVVLTILSFIISVWLVSNVVQQANKALKDFGNF